MNRLRQLVRSEGGYTLLEMVSVIAIISVLTGLVVANTVIGNKRQQLRDTVSGYVAAAKQAEGLAASGQTVTSGSEQTSRAAYGVCITSSAITNSRCSAISNAATQPLDTYQVYGRLSTDTNYATRPNNPDIIASYTAPKNIIFTSQAVWLDYLPPGPDLLANGNGNPGTNPVVTAQVVGNSSYTRSAIIRPKAGAVYVQ